VEYIESDEEREGIGMEDGKYSVLYLAQAESLLNDGD
jgi:hypothetical protein